MCSPMKAHWRHLANTIELVLPSAHPSPHPKRKSISLAVFAQCRRVSSGTLAPPSQYDWASASYGPSESTTQTVNRSVKPFCTAHATTSLYFTIGVRFPKNCPFPWRSGPPCNTWFLGPIRAHKPNGISIVSAVSAHITSEFPYTLQLGEPFPLKIAPSHGGSGPPSNTWLTVDPVGRIYVRSTTMRSNNNNSNIVST